MRKDTQSSRKKKRPSRIYGRMDPDMKEDYARLLAMETNAYLKKIYSGIGRKAKLQPQKIAPSQIVMKHASLGATKMWEFRPNPREKAAKGDVGSVLVVTRGLDDQVIRKQRALFIAAEYYVYHSFANHPDPAVYRSIMGQNQYWDMLKKALRMKNSHDTRDQAIRYVIEEIKEHKLAHHRGNGWFISIAKLKRHYPDIAETLGSSEQTFHEIFKKQNQTFTPDMLKQEEDLIRKEMEDIDHLTSELKQHEHRRLPQHTKRLIEIHLANLKTFRDVLQKVIDNFSKWEVVDKEEHKELKKHLIRPQDIQGLIEAEAEAERIDINKIHILFNYFEKEKINILRDLELIERMGDHDREGRSSSNPKKK